MYFIGLMPDIRRIKKMTNIHLSIMVYGFEKKIKNT